MTTEQLVVEGAANSVVRIGQLSDFVDGEARQVRVSSLGIALVVIRLGDEVYVLNDRCSHEDFSLAEGEVDPSLGSVECARHGALFDVRTGDALTFPATQPVKKYDVVVRDGAVEVQL